MCCKREKVEIHSDKYEEIIKSIREEVIAKNNMLKLKHMRTLLEDLFVLSGDKPSDIQVREYEVFTNELNRLDAMIEEIETNPNRIIPFFPNCWSKELEEAIMEHIEENNHK